MFKGFGARKRQRTFTCPHCGADVRVGAAACRACGSDAETGWADDADDLQPGIPSGHGGKDEFDYDGFVRREFGDAQWRLLGYSKRQWQAIIASVLVLAFLYLILR